MSFNEFLSAPALTFVSDDSRSSDSSSATYESSTTSSLAPKDLPALNPLSFPGILKALRKLIGPENVLLLSHISSASLVSGSGQHVKNNASSDSEEHIRRPPNAFIIFRSDLIRVLKERQMPDKRQQNLSRIAGECWNLTPAKEKKPWYERADAIKEDHKVKYPDYKFQPRRRTATPRPRSAPKAADPAYIRKVREAYTGRMGPPAPSSRAVRLEARKARIAAREAAKNASATQQASGTGQLPVAPQQQFDAAPVYSPDFLDPNCAQALSVNMLGLTLAGNVEWPIVTAPSAPAFSGSQSFESFGPANGGNDDFVDNDPTPTAASFSYIAPPPPADTSSNDFPADFSDEASFEAWAQSVLNMLPSEPSGSTTDSDSLDLMSILAPFESESQQVDTDFSSLLMSEDDMLLDWGL